MPGSKLLGSHRLGYQVMTNQIEADGQYVVNNEKKAAQTGKKNIRAAQSYLWSQVPLNPNNSSYQFNVRNGVANLGNPGILAGENRLKDQDVFFTYALGYYLVCTSTGFGNTSLQFDLMTYPSPNFWGPLSGGVPIRNFQGLWTMGTLAVKVNGETLTPSWDMGQHMYQPQTQIQPYIAPGQNPLAYFDEKDLAQDGLVITEPNWIVNGGNDNNYTVSFPQNYAQMLIPDPALYNWRFSLVMKWQGFLAQNASSIMNNAPARNV